MFIPSTTQTLVILLVHILYVTEGVAIPEQTLIKNLELSDYEDYKFGEEEDLSSATTVTNTNHTQTKGDIPPESKSKPQPPNGTECTFPQLPLVLNPQNQSEEVPVLAPLQLLNITSDSEEPSLEEKIRLTLGPRPQPEEDTTGVQVRSRSNYGYRMPSESYHMPNLVNSMYQTVEDIASLRSSFRENVRVVNSVLHALDNRITKLIKGKVRSLEEADVATLSKIRDVVQETDKKLVRTKQDYEQSVDHVQAQTTRGEQNVANLVQQVEMNWVQCEKNRVELSHYYDKLREDSQATDARHLDLIQRLEKILNGRKGPKIDPVDTEVYVDPTHGREVDESIFSMIQRH